MSQEIDKLQIKFKAAITLLVILIICGFFVFSLLYLKEAAWALQGNYNKVSGGQLTIDEWNYLDEDFLLKEGDTWQGPGSLDMGGNSITNLNTDLISPNLTDAANVEYVTQEIAAAPTTGGGDVFTIWGEDSCPGISTPLYTGIAFSALYSSGSGGSNPICVQGGDAGGPYVKINADKMYPLVTSQNSAYLPAGIANDSIVRCAVCHYPVGTCYNHFGSFNCASGFDSTNGYDGYLLGSATSVTDHVNSTKRACVSRNFNALSAGGNMGAMWYGTRIEYSFGSGYTVDTFIRCAVCCN